MIENVCVYDAWGFNDCVFVCCLTELCLSQDLVQLVLHRELVEYSVCTSCLMCCISCYFL